MICVLLLCHALPSPSNPTLKYRHSTPLGIITFLEICLFLPPHTTPITIGNLCKRAIGCMHTHACANKGVTVSTVAIIPPPPKKDHFVLQLYNP